MSRVSHVVYDEADTLLDDSFNEVLRHFMRRLPVCILPIIIETLLKAQYIYTSLPNLKCTNPSSSVPEKAALHSGGTRLHYDHYNLTVLNLNVT